ncbi:MAG: hypothetical protein VW455_01125 [Nitrospinota bacterium]
MPKINIFCQASFKKGLGHLIRQIHIANELRARNADVFFYIPKFQTAEDIIKDHNFSFSIVENFDSGFSEITEPTDVTLLDIQDTTATLIKNLRKQSKKIISFEDQGDGRNHVDLLIDCNLHPEDSKSIPTQILYGLPYSVLAPEFEKLHSKERHFEGQIQSLLITFGGTDPHNITLDLTKHIPNETKATIIAGPGFNSFQKLKELDSNRFCVVQNIQDMASMLASFDAVFCSGGVTLHEAMCVGTPAFVISQVPHQEDKAKAAEKSGAAINLGQAHSWNKDRLPEIFQLEKKDLLAMSTAGKNQIDGKGLQRIIEFIL